MVNKGVNGVDNTINMIGSSSSSGENIVNVEHNHHGLHRTTPGSFNEIDVQSINNDEEIKNHFTHVKVLHNFRGSNNDELCMKKDDIITLTQTPSGGWWEGTLDGITGWFPANYVQPISNQDPLYQQIVHGQQQSSSGIETLRSGSSELCPTGYHSGDWNSPGTPIDSMSDHLAEYRSIVMKVIEDSETQFIESLQDAINHYLMPIYQFKILPTETELNAVLRSITEICSVHRRFLTSIEKTKSVPHKDNRIGGLFMQYAPQFKHAHFEYCSHHAKFVHVIEKYKKEICAFFATNPQPVPVSLAQTLASPSHQLSSASANLASMPNVQITALLSVSFRRLDKYPALLQELQRYTEENHSDRGDIQRAGFLYREISMSCLELRRRKEMELEVMLGNIKNFDKMNIESYGQIIKMEPVTILLLPLWKEPKKDCYLVLFPKVLMILSVGKEMTSFTYEAMIKLENAKLKPINASTAAAATNDFSIEISGQNAHPQPDQSSTSEHLQYVVRFNDEEVWRDYYQNLQKQIRHQTTTHNQLAESSSSSMPQTSGTTVASSSSSSQSSSAIFSPQSSTSLSITSPDQPVPLSLPPKPPQYRIQHMIPPCLEEIPPPLPHHRRSPPAVPPPNAPKMSIESVLKSLPKRSSGYWSNQILTPHQPYRPTDLPIHFNQMAAGDSGTLTQESPNDDMQLLNVIDAYHRKFPSNNCRGSGGEHQLSSLSSLSELEPYQYVEIVGVNKSIGHQANVHLQRNPSARNARKNSLTMLAQKINKLSLSSMDRDVLYEIYDQLRVIRNEMSHLGEKVRDERRQRKRIQHSLAKLHQQQQNNLNT
ncbi:rho-type guanine nucleotide exchange factor [Dermatophagoides pteronyssinus]|uniref:rho-type guanine nucleotide exchange factor n=1 Tax=Dermatophagoides pteronyssinus TaxID=6956 RepID=UPI003F67E6AE